MGADPYVIRAVESAGVDSFVAYLEDHVKDNGREGLPLFQPQARSAVWVTAEKAAAFRAGLDAPLATAGWRRIWGAFDARGELVGHADLRARPEPHTSHRALIGLGVHRNHRRLGLARRLVAHVLVWAATQPSLAWIDLTVLDGNAIAQDLYRSMGFAEVGRVPDMFRIDGASVTDIHMTRRTRD